MRNIYEDELDVLWDNYDARIMEVGFEAILTEDFKTLQPKFALSYSDIHYQVKQKNSHKPRNELSYNLLKLRRLFALWKENNIVLIEGGIRYEYRDAHKQFPKYNKQNPTILPSEKTINKIRIKALVGYVEKNNISNLRELRFDLVRKVGLDDKNANFLVDIYRKMQTRSEVNLFSEIGDDYLQN